MTDSITFYRDVVQRYDRVNCPQLLVFTHTFYGEDAQRATGGVEGNFNWDAMHDGEWQRLIKTFVPHLGDFMKALDNPRVSVQIWNEGDAAPNARASVHIPNIQYANLLESIIGKWQELGLTNPIITQGLTGGPAAEATYTEVFLRLLSERNVDTSYIKGLATHPYGRGKTRGDLAHFGTLDEVFNAYRAFGIPLVISEWGFLNHPDYPAGSAAVYARHFLDALHASQLVHQAYWYSLYQNMDNGYGLLDASGSPRRPLHSVFFPADVVASDDTALRVGVTRLLPQEYMVGGSLRSKTTTGLRMRVRPDMNSDPVGLISDKQIVTLLDNEATFDGEHWRVKIRRLEDNTDGYIALIAEDRALSPADIGMILQPVTLTSMRYNGAHLSLLRSTPKILRLNGKVSHENKIGELNKGATVLVYDDQHTVIDNRHWLTVRQANQDAYILLLKPSADGVANATVSDLFTLATQPDITPITPIIPVTDPTDPHMIRINRNLFDTLRRRTIASKQHHTEGIQHCDELLRLLETIV